MRQGVLLAVKVDEQDVGRAIGATGPHRVANGAAMHDSRGIDALNQAPAARVVDKR